MKFTLSSILFLLSVSVFGQTTLNEVNTESFGNYGSSYNYTYWNENWKTITNQDRSFSNQTSAYGFQVNYHELNIENLILNNHNWDKNQAFDALHDSIFNLSHSGNIDYAILHTGLNNYNKPAVSPTNLGNKDSQMAEYGTWCNRRFVSTNFTNNPSIEPYFTGIEFTTWHNRWKMTFHVRPTAAIVNGRLQLSFTMPAAYSQYYTDNTHYAFGLDPQKGFVVKTEDAGATISVSGNTITVLTTAQNLSAGQSYAVSLIFKPMLQDLATNFATTFDEESPVSLNVHQSLPTVQNLNSNTSYSSIEGMHLIDLPRYVMGQYDCNTNGVLQQVGFSVSNTSNLSKRVRLCFRQVPNVNVTGFNSLLCNSNGDPSGLPIQVSKNWHTGTAQLFSGSWIKEYTEVIVPPNTTLNLAYRRTGALWGSTYAASSHQLSVVGAGVPRGGWLEAALGSYGESITHSPDVEYGNSNGCDLRPFLVTNGNYGGTSSACNWTGNVGGLDFWIYDDNSNTRQYQSEVKTQFNRYSPNLSQTTIGAISADKKLKYSYTFYLNRSDDFTRVYYRVKIKALDTVHFNRFDFFQLGGDTYNHHNTQQVAVGNDTGVVAQFSPTTNGSNDYTTAATALVGNDPWIWAGDGFSYGNLSGGLAINTNNGLIIRDYKANLNGQSNNTPYFRERSSSQGFSAQYNTNPTSYCLVPPPTITAFYPGDEVEMLLEVAVLPKTIGDYYGPNQNFESAIAQHQNTYGLLFREVTGNQVVATSPTNVIQSGYPITVETQNNTALVELEGGLGYVPLVFSGLDSVSNPILWRAVDNCWEVVDQSVHGKDFWQADFKSAEQRFDLTFNVDQDGPNDDRMTILYYLGDTPPSTTILAKSSLNGNPVVTDTIFSLFDDVDSIILSPQILHFDSTEMDGIDSNYNWTGPNGFTSVGQIINFSPITHLDSGSYTVFYSSPFGCEDSMQIHLNVQIPSYCDTNGISMVPRSKVRSFDFSDDTSIVLMNGYDTLLLSPQIQFSDSSLSAGIDGNWNWSGPNSFSQIGREVLLAPITYLDSGTYTVHYTDSSGCQYSLNYHVVVIPFDCDSSTMMLVSRSQLNSSSFTSDPIINLTGGVDDLLLSPIIVNANATISFGIDTNFHWDGPNGFAHIGREFQFTPFNFNDEGTYLVRYLDTLGCIDSTAYFVAADSSQLSLNLNQLDTIQITPNPTSNLFKISVKSEHTWIYNSEGRLVLEFTEPRDTFDISGLANGTYIAHFRPVEKGIIQRVIIKK